MTFFPWGLNRPEESVKLFQLLSGAFSPGPTGYLLGDLPFASREIGVRAIANPVCTSRAIQTSELRSPMATPWDLVPPVPALIDGPVESGNRYSRFQRVNSYLANRRTPICDGLVLLAPCELTPSQLLLDLTVDGNSRFFTAISSRRFSSS
jgi:hypothetical protein